MKKKDFIMHVSDYFDIIKDQTATTNVTIRVDVFKGGIGRVKVTQEHELTEYLNKNGDNSKKYVNK